MCASIQCLIVLFLCYYVKTEVFTAISDMAPLLETRQSIIDDVHEYLRLEDVRLATLKKRLDLYKTEHEKAMRDVSGYIGNPISAFTLIKSLTTDLDYIRSIVESATENSKNITSNHKDIKYPAQEDLVGAAEAISRLQEVYQLDTHELAEGKLDFVFSHQMTAEDCFELGRALYDVGDHKTALSWLTEAQRKITNHTEIYQFTEIDILEYKTSSHFKLREFKTAFHFAIKMLKMDPNHERAAKFTLFCSKLIAEEETKEMIKQLNGEKPIEESLTEGQKNWMRDLKNYKRLCRGEMDISASIAKKLSCEYLSGNQPYLKIAPFKVEHMCLNPVIIVFRDVMGDSEIEFIQNIAKNRFERAKVIKITGPTTSKIRISKTAWLTDGDSDVVARVSRRVADMTGLSLDTAEDLQVANYGLGGYYIPHNDYNSRMFGRNDDRIATVLFYMSDVAQGGATVFPRLGVRLVPKKGSAAFWLNLHPSGEGDLSTRHAACPVLRGSKWISTRWIHSTGQEFLKPCKLNYQDSWN